MRPCYTFTAQAGDRPAVLALDNEIGFWGNQASDFRAALDQVSGDTIEVQINSPGGDVMAGLGMYHMLRNLAANGKTVVTKVTALAGSIASVIALAGDRRIMPSNTFAMMHGASGGVFGTEDEVRDYADVMAKVNSTIRNLYVERMGITEEKAAELTAKDNWLTAAECKELGFATELDEPVTATAKFDLARADLPAHVAKVFQAKAETDPETEEEGEPETEEEGEPAEVVPDTPVAEQIVALAKASGLEAHAVTLAVACASVDDAKTRITTAREITALCAAAGKPQAATAAIRANKPLADVRAELLQALADSDQDIDTTPPEASDKSTGGGNAKPAAVNTQTIWASHSKASKKGR